MSNKKDYYKILGLNSSASEKDIKRAYRRLARKYHPDVNPGDRASEERFKELQEAYNVLSDPPKRQIYDQVGYYSENMQQPPSNSSRDGFDFSGFDFREAGGSSFSEIFSDLFRDGGKHESAPQKGQDLYHHVKLSFMDAVHGRSMRISLQRGEACESCSGSGQSRSRLSETCTVCGGTGKSNRSRGFLQFSTTCQSCGGTGKGHLIYCSHCNGQGRYPRTDTITVRIPPGVIDGSRVRVPGKGDAGVQGAPSGDLYLVINIEAHDFFRREKNDILCTVPVTITEAALGAKIEVPTLEGKSILRIPPGTQTGQKFRLRGKGIISPRGEGSGDLIVEVRIHMPRLSDERSKEILREFARLNPEDPRIALNNI